jgi:xylulokinase
MKELVCCLDFGTTRIKAAFIDENGNVAAICGEQAPGGDNDFEFDVEAHFQTGLRLIRKMSSENGEAAKTVAAVSVTNQRATIVAVGEGGVPVGSAVSWLDTRCEKNFSNFIAKYGAARFTCITGLPASALWSLPKILWLRETRPEIFSRTEKFVLLHDYILRRFGAEEFITDYSNASLAGLLDIEKLTWSGEILEAAGLEESRLPRLMPAGSIAGRLSDEASSSAGLTAGIPIVVGGGDQQCAALGVGALDEGDAGLCLGTAAVISCPVGRPVRDSAGGFFCTAHVVPGRWVLEGFHNTFGSAVNWVSDMLGAAKVQELEALASASPPGAAGVTFLPFLAGIGSPDFDSSVRGAFLGLGLEHGRGDMARAAIEGVCFEMRRILDAAGPYVRIGRIIVAGGLSAGSVISNSLAGITGRELLLRETPETTLIGAAIIAWTGAGKFGGVRDGAKFCSGGAKHNAVSVKADATLEDRYNLYKRRVVVVRSLNENGDRH